MKKVFILSFALIFLMLLFSCEQPNNSNDSVKNDDSNSSISEINVENGIYKDSVYGYIIKIADNVFESLAFGDGNWVRGENENINNFSLNFTSGDLKNDVARGSITASNKIAVQSPIDKSINLIFEKTNITYDESYATVPTSIQDKIEVEYDELDNKTSVSYTDSILKIYEENYILRMLGTVIVRDEEDNDCTFGLLSTYTHTDDINMDEVLFLDDNLNRLEIDYGLVNWQEKLNSTTYTETFISFPTDNQIDFLFHLLQSDSDVYCAFLGTSENLPKVKLSQEHRFVLIALIKEYKKLLHSI